MAESNASTATGSTAAAATESAAVPAAPAGPRVKTRKLRQRACDEKDEKGKVCCGHLKRWYDYPPELAAVAGAAGELYRCENCKTLYLPNPRELPRSYTQRF